MTKIYHHDGHGNSTFMYDSDTVTSLEEILASSYKQLRKTLTIQEIYDYLGLAEIEREEKDIK